MLNHSRTKYSKTKLAAAIAGIVSSVGTVSVQAQDGAALEEIVVTGIRGSLQRAMDIKRNASGVVDAISAEDIGKFPDTNLAESLQRITGVSINRVNGEGSEVTVRGFGGNFNLITLNGRQLPSANVASATGNSLDARFQSGTSRSFDFSSLASEGVSGIQVYKTGRASAPTGGIGATVNIQTVKPLEQGEQFTVGVKAMNDKSGDDVTPEISSLFSWANDEDSFGVSLFGSFQERDSGSRVQNTERINLINYDTSDVAGSLGPLGTVAPGLVIGNEPADGQLIGLPTDIGLGFNEDQRERTNGQLTVQFRPSDRLTLTADATYAKNEQTTDTVLGGIWFYGDISELEFDGNEVAAPTRWTQSVAAGADHFSKNYNITTEDSMQSYGFNAEFEASDNLTLRFDVATSESESGGTGPGGVNSTRLNVSAQGPRTATIELAANGNINRAIAIGPSGTGTGLGFFDVDTQVGSQRIQTTNSSQKTTVDQFQFDGTWEFSENVTVDFGVGYLDSESAQNLVELDTLVGNWVSSFPGDIAQIDPSLVREVCGTCQFSDLDPSSVTPGAALSADAAAAGQTPQAIGQTIHRVDAAVVADALLNNPSSIYFNPTDPNIVGREVANEVANENNIVGEEVTSLYAQATLDGELGGMATNLVLGLRWEGTDVTSSSRVVVPQSFVWEGDDDLVVNLALPDGSQQIDTIVDTHSYNAFLPSIDFSIELTDSVKARASFSQTLARPRYDQLFSSVQVSEPARAVALGGVVGANRGDVALDPLQSNNFDLSVEWYYDESSFVSAGFYRKIVDNFVGTEQITESLFGLRDPSSGQPGTLNGDAVAALEAGGHTINDANLFAMTVVLDNPADFPGGVADFVPGFAFAGSLSSAGFTVESAASDPIVDIQSTAPVNNESAEISGFEFAAQHFFGESGFGIQANYTTVNGDIAYDVLGDISQDQFALEGLSDSANLVLIYEKGALSARLAYNWRDEFLDETNRSVERGGNRNPVFIDEFQQIDLGVSYEVSDNLTVTFDAINIGEEGTLQFGRSKNHIFFSQELDTRYALGIHYKM